MKTKKMLKKITLISLVMMISVGIFNYSNASVGEVIVTGILILFGTILQEAALLILSALELITAGITGLGDAEGSATMGDVVFNRCSLTSANFFPDLFPNINTTSSFANFGADVGKYYTIMRGLAIAILLGILLYVGIRMAISTVAEKEAKYKKMFFDWTISLVLVFVLHYIIMLVFYANNTLVDVLSKMDSTANSDGIMMLKLAGAAAVPRSRLG